MISFPKTDLHLADLREADLRGADLREADLRGADLEGANLREADLRGADLKAANLRGADLRGAALEGADLEGAVLTGAALDNNYVYAQVLYDLSDEGLTYAPLYEIFEELLGEPSPSGHRIISRPAAERAILNNIRAHIEFAKLARLGDKIFTHRP